MRRSCVFDEEIPKKKRKYEEEINASVLCKKSTVVLKKMEFKSNEKENNVEKIKNHSSDTKSKQKTNVLNNKSFDYKNMIESSSEESESEVGDSDIEELFADLKQSGFKNFDKSKKSPNAQNQKGKLKNETPTKLNKSVTSPEKKLTSPKSEKADMVNFSYKSPSELMLNFKRTPKKKKPFVYSSDTSDSPKARESNNKPELKNSPQKIAKIKIKINDLKVEQKLSRNSVEQNSSSKSYKKARLSIRRSISPEEDNVFTPKSSKKMRLSIKKCDSPERAARSRSPSTPVSVQRRSQRSSAQKSNTLNKLISTPDKNMFDVTPKKRSSSRKSLLQEATTPRKNLLIQDPVTPSQRNVPKTPQTPIEKIRSNLHVSAVPDSLPCRDKEYANVMNFLQNRLYDGVGGCMYISGVPGTGKTATVTQVIRQLQKTAEEGDLPKFKYIELNGMRLSDPRQAYVQLWQRMSGKTERISSEQAYKKLDSWFSKSDKKKMTTVVLVDEGLTRLTFMPYTHKQLEEIVVARLSGFDAFVPDAIRLATRKVAAVSGDARRALDICRRATELPGPDEVVKITHIEQAIREMTNSSMALVIRGRSKMEKLFLRSITAVSTRCGLDEVAYLSVLDQFNAACTLDGHPKPTPGEILSICNRLKNCRIILAKPLLGGVLQKLTLNVTQDEVHYALREE